ncbi:EAL domain-containing protein [Notoacmeibacter sp. MSK16QG-6]|uniref:EAL domain-containing protein n=1 Tax=Notoacmeibacter sp. MSK16QG-6 TaxID=2957982 RepID=UPI0020A098D1|nr:EAL domain-containing protein [Notoacmeibacter sp. MSK16QG-6]MCP1198512.1 EAL domain-containing protein [Notoacmeibacter sp. MSK16QG-6]
MRKVLLVLFVIMLFLAIYQVLTPILSANPDFSSLVVRDVLVVSLLIAALALIIALVALMRASRIQRQTEDRLIAIDMALSDFANRADVAALSMADLARATHRDIVTMRQQMDEGARPGPATADMKTRSGKVVPIKIEQAEKSADQDNSGDPASLLQMIEAGEPRLSLQPIVDVIESRPVAFEAYASYGSDGQTLDIQRANDLPDEAQAKLARILLAKSAQAARRISAEKPSEPHSMHVPLSTAFIADLDEQTINMSEPPNSGDIVLSLPLSALLDNAVPKTSHEWRPVLACESDSFPSEHMPLLAEADVRWLKLPAKAVLSEADSERYSFVCGPLGIDLLITHVHDKEEAVSLLDRGFRYMSGPHFGIPRPMRDET